MYEHATSIIGLRGDVKGAKRAARRESRRAKELQNSLEQEQTARACIEHALEAATAALQAERTAREAAEAAVSGSENLNEADSLVAAERAQRLALEGRIAAERAGKLAAEELIKVERNGRLVAEGQLEMERTARAQAEERLQTERAEGAQRVAFESRIAAERAGKLAAELVKKERAGRLAAEGQLERSRKPETDFRADALRLANLKRDATVQDVHRLVERDKTHQAALKQLREQTRVIDALRKQLAMLEQKGACWAWRLANRHDSEATSPRKQLAQRRQATDSEATSPEKQLAQRRQATVLQRAPTGQEDGYKMWLGNSFDEVVNNPLPWRVDTNSPTKATPRGPDTDETRRVKDSTTAIPQPPAEGGVAKQPSVPEQAKPKVQHKKLEKSRAILRDTSGRQKLEEMHQHQTASAGIDFRADALRLANVKRNATVQDVHRLVEREKAVRQERAGTKFAPSGGTSGTLSKQHTEPGGYRSFINPRSGKVLNI